MTLLVADDLKSMHRYIEACIPWEEEEITKIYHAYDGQECVRLVREHSPDILLLDIKMPIYDGVKVLQILSEREYMPKVLIISAYNDFQYVRHALKYGAADYLMKPVNVETLLHSVREIVADLHKQCLRNIKSYLLDLPIADKRSDLQSDIQRLGLKWVNCAQVVFSGNTQRIRAAKKRLLECYPFSVELTEKELLILIPASDEKEETSLNEFQTLVHQIAKEDWMSVFAGVSKRADISAEGIHTVFDQSSSAIACRYFSNTSVVFQYDENAFGTIDQGLISRYKIKLTKALLEQATEDVKNVIAEMFEQLTVLHPNQQQLVDACYSILVYSINYLFVSYNSVETELTERLVLEKLDACQSIVRLREVFEQILLEKAAESDPARNIQKDRTIEKVEQYLKENYMHSLTLENLSAKFFISKYELCRKFKTVTGENLWEHIANIRIRQAKHLLRSSELRISEVAGKVGYHDPTYFSSIFKRQVGISPKQYREQNR